MRNHQIRALHFVSMADRFQARVNQLVATGDRDPLGKIANYLVIYTNAGNLLENMNIKKNIPSKILLKSIGLKAS